LEYYADEISLIPDFFNATVFRKFFPIEKAKIITSIALFYDLGNPSAIVQDIELVLAEYGI